jgi:hypothetical protein
VARKRQRVSQFRPRHTDNGRGSNGDTSPDQPAYVEEMLDLLTRQTAELRRLATLVAKGTSSTVKIPPTSKETADRARGKS